MPRRALIESRPWLLASVIAALAFYFLWNNPIGGLWLILLKGSAVGFLAIYVVRRAPGINANLLFAVLLLSALGDMAIELSLEYGGALFAGSHVIAVILYALNRRKHVAPSQWALAAALILVTPLVSWLLSGSALVALYALLLGAMAASAWVSRFPRYRVGVGAVLFVISDWLIFGRLGPLDLQAPADILVWPLYITGQLMIATGVVQTLRKEHVAR